MSPFSQHHGCSQRKHPFVINSGYACCSSPFGASVLRNAAGPPGELSNRQQRRSGIVRVFRVQAVRASADWTEWSVVSQSNVWIFLDVEDVNNHNLIDARHGAVNNPPHDAVPTSSYFTRIRSSSSASALRVFQPKSDMFLVFHP